MTINKCFFTSANLSTGTSYSYDERIIEAQYRAGNAQRAYSGDAEQRISVNLDFIPMDFDDKELLLNFYLDVGLVLYFNWTMIDETDSKVWRFSAPVSITPNADMYTATAALEQVPNGTATTNTETQLPYSADPLPPPTGHTNNHKAYL